MRHHPTPSEARLFAVIRGRRLGVAFRRQQVVGNFIVDFLARKERLVIEVDGDAYHTERRAADAARDRKLRRAGYFVVRLSASMVERDPKRSLQLIQVGIAYCRR
jgi:very-short-patch-repair endonuclease